MPQTPDHRPEPVQSPEISLNELTEAFAQAMAGHPEPEIGPDEAELEESSPQPAEAIENDALSEQENSQPVAYGRQPTAEQDDSCEISPQTILEAMLFVGNREGQPLSASRAAELMRDVEPAEIAALVDQLNRRYAAEGCPYRITHEGSGYRLTLRKAFHPLRNRFYSRIREARLSQAAIDMLAIVAYQQPLTGEEIGRLRGKPGGSVLSQLVRRGLLRIERKDSKQRTAQYFTTDRFLQLFGMESLEDLPQSEELQRR